jgi:hypothetical protein
VNFLSTIFPPGAAGESAMPYTSSVQGDPTKAKFAYSRSLGEDTDNFFCVSSVNLGDRDTPRRRKEDVVAFHVLVVDDVGTKIKPAFVTNLIGKPSYVLETSPGNYHWGYILTEPCVDLSKANGLVRAAGKKLGSDANDLNRVVRLPVGTNSKPKYMKDGEPFRCELKVWQPERRVDIDYLMSQLDGSPVAVTTKTLKQYIPDPADDLVLAALDAWGFLLSQTMNDGAYPLNCPWSDEHTDGDPKGAYYIPGAELPQRRFYCHHHTCASRTFDDLVVFLNLAVNEVEAVFAAAEFKGITGTDAAPPSTATVEPVDDEPVTDGLGEALGFTDDDRNDALGELFTDPDPRNDGQIYLDNTMAALTGSPPLTEPIGEPSPNPENSVSDDPRIERPWHEGSVEEWHPMRGAMPSEPPERQWLFDDLVLDRIPWMLAGEGGAGKSRLMLALAIAVATGRSFGPFTPGRKGRVLFLSKEDDREEVRHRYVAQIRLWHEYESFTEEELIDLAENLWIPEGIDHLNLGDGVEAGAQHRLREQVEWLVERDRTRGVPLEAIDSTAPILLTIVDPLGQWWDDEGDQGRGMNSQEGAATMISQLRSMKRLAAGGAFGGREWERDLPAASIVSVHHHNKLGGVTGSAQIKDFHRAVFQVSLADGRSDGRRLVRVTLTKANASSRVGDSYYFELVADGALWPADPEAEALMVSRDRAVLLIHRRGLQNEISRVELKKALQDEGTSRRVAESAVGEFEELDEDLLIAYGIELRGTPKRRRFAAVAPLAEGVIPGVDLADLPTTPEVGDVSDLGDGTEGEPADGALDALFA